MGGYVCLYIGNIGISYTVCYTVYNVHYRVYIVNYIWCAFKDEYYVINIAVHLSMGHF